MHDLSWSYPIVLHKSSNPTILASLLRNLSHISTTQWYLNELLLFVLLLMSLFKPIQYDYRLHVISWIDSCVLNSVFRPWNILYPKSFLSESGKLCYTYWIVHTSNNTMDLIEISLECLKIESRNVSSKKFIRIMQKNHAMFLFWIVPPITFRIVTYNIYICIVNMPGIYIWIQRHWHRYWQYLKILWTI